MPFHITVSTLNLDHESQGQCKAKPYGSIFSNTFQLIRIKFGMTLKKLKLNVLLLSKITEYVTKALMHSNIYELI